MKTNHEILWLASLHTGWGICLPPRLFRLRRRCVAPPPPPRHLAPHLSPPPSRPCFSSSSLCHPLDSPVVDVVASSLVAVWLSVIFLPLRILRRARLTCPHPFGKGRGGLGCNLACEGAEGVLKEPTSLIRGEGLVAVLTCEVGGVEDEGEGEGGGGGGRRE